jgi:hypothetical protein
MSFIPRQCAATPGRPQSCITRLLSSERPRAGHNAFARECYLRYKDFVSTRELIEQEVACLPEPLQKEVYDFARFLRETKAEDTLNGLLLSESSLAQDWSHPEEDKAWASL